MDGGDGGAGAVGTVKKTGKHHDCGASPFVICRVVEGHPPFAGVAGVMGQAYSALD